jgi:hypothetical protein
MGRRTRLKNSNPHCGANRHCGNHFGARIALISEPGNAESTACTAGSLTTATATFKASVFAIVQRMRSAVDFSAE